MNCDVVVVSICFYSISIKKKVARASRYSGLGVRSVGSVGDFLDNCCYK